MKLVNTGVGYIRSKLFQFPFYVRIHVTHRCNQRCRMCRVPDSADDYKEMNLEKIKY